MPYFCKTTLLLSLLAAILALLVGAHQAGYTYPSCSTSSARSAPSYLISCILPSTQPQHDGSVPSPRPPHGHLRKRHGVHHNHGGEYHHDQLEPLLASAAAAPLLKRATDDTIKAASSTPAFLNIVLSSTGTLNLRPFLPASLSNNSNIPVLLDLLSPCSWVASENIACINPDQPRPSPSSVGDANTTRNDSGGEVEDLYVLPENCLRGPGHTGGDVAAVLAPDLDDNTVSGGKDGGMCSHYLTGSVSGPVQRLPLSLGSVVRGLPSNGSEGLGDELHEKVDVDFIIANEFTAPFPLGLLDFQVYYSGASGVLGLGGNIDDLTKNPADNGTTAPNENLTSSSGVDSSSYTLLDALFSTADATMRKILGIALPRDGLLGNLTIGASVRDVSDPADFDFSGDLSMLDAPASGPVARHTGEKPSLDMPWSLPSITVEVAANTSQPARLQHALNSARYADPAIRHDLQDGEQYFIDTALPVIWTSSETARFVAGLFEPAGWFDKPISTNNVTGSNATSAGASSAEPQLEAPGTWRVSCDADPPKSISIGDTDGTRYVSVPLYPEDLVVRMRLHGEGQEGMCMSAFQNGDLSDVYGPVKRHGRDDGEVLKLRRLGWPFLRNVLLDFDLDAREVRVAVRRWPLAGDGGTVSGSSNLSTATRTRTFTEASAEWTGFWTITTPSSMASADGDGTAASWLTETVWTPPANSTTTTSDDILSFPPSITSEASPTTAPTTTPTPTSSTEDILSFPSSLTSSTTSTTPSSTTSYPPAPPPTPPCSVPPIIFPTTEASHTPSTGSFTTRPDQFGDPPDVWPLTTPDWVTRTAD